MFSLITLPYTIDALEPVISARTLEFHHGKHLQGYVDNLNKLISGTDLEDKSLEEIVVISSAGKASSSVISSSSSVISSEVEKSKAIFNNAGQILNHNLYFTQFRSVIPSPSSVISSEVEKSIAPSLPAPTGNLLAQIEKQFGSFDAFKSDFESAGTTLFGSGWVWLSAAPDGTLVITQEPGASNPICHTVISSAGEAGVEKSRLKPLLTFDVWEHAYYLDYQNRRAAHLKELWEIVDWRVVEERYVD